MYVNNTLYDIEKEIAEFIHCGNYLTEIQAKTKANEWITRIQAVMYKYANTKPEDRLKLDMCHSWNGIICDNRQIPEIISCTEDCEINKWLKQAEEIFTAKGQRTNEL